MERLEIKKMLPHGAMKEIAEMAGVSQNLVYQYFSGRSNNALIESAALKVAIAHAKGLQGLKKDKGILEELLASIK